MEAEAELLTLMILLFISSNSCSDGVSPSFSKEPTSATVFRGQNVTLTCDAGPCCGVRVQWLYNGTYLSDSPSDKRLTVSGSELSIASFSGSPPETKEFYNAEIYQCVATNRFGSIISKPATITYAGGERLVNVSAHQTIIAFEANNVILPCRSAVKNACLSVEWEHNGSHLRLTSRHKILPSNSIQIEDFVGRDIGTYRCLCFNSLTSYQPVSSSVHLKVENSTTSFTSSFVWASPRNQQVVEGQTLVLECSAVGRPRPLVTWLRYGGVLSPERHSQDRGILSIRQVNRSDEGTYICRAENTAGPQQIHVVFVEVLQPPIIVSPPVDQETTRGGRVTFTCRSRGLPRPSLTWYHNAVPVVKSAFVKITGDGALVLAEVAENQSGIYQCMASNAVDCTSASARLTVHPSRLTNASHSRAGVVRKKGRRNFQVLRSKRPIRTPVTVTTSSSTPSNFPVNENNLPEAEGDAKEQTKEAKLMQSNGTRRPSHKRPKPRDSLRPTYWTQKKPGLSLVPPSKPSAKVMTDTSVELKWTKGHQTTGLNVTLFKVQFKEIKTQKRRKPARWQTIDEDISPDITRFTVGNLKPGSAYQFRLVAIYSNNDNKHGPNSDQVLLSVTGQQVKIPLTAPIIVAVNPLSDSEMSIKWQYLPIKREIATGFMIHHKPYETSMGYKQFVVHGIERRETILSGLFQDTTYSLRMQTFNSEGLSEYSNTAVKKTFGPSDNSTDIYPLQNHTPPLFYPLNNDHRPNVNENGDDPFEARRNPGTTSGAESNAPWNRASSYSQQNRDMLFVVLGVVLGGVFIVVVFIIVFCLWRQRQHQLLLAAAEARSKPCNARSAFHANSLAVMELKNFAGEPIKNSDACSGKRTPTKKNHIPNYFGNGCLVNSGGSSRSRDYLENGIHCSQRGPADEGHQLLQHLSTNKSKTVCQPRCKSANGLHDHEPANSVNGWHCDASDGTASKGQLPPPSSSADCSDIYNSEGQPRRAPCFRPSLHEEPVETPPSECAACDQFSCRRRRHLPSPLASPLSDPLPPPPPPPMKRSCASSSSSSSSSDSSSSSLSSSLSGCSYNCHRQQQQRRHFEKNDSGVYDEHSCETRSENKTQLLPQPPPPPSDSNEISAL